MNILTYAHTTYRKVVEFGLYMKHCKVDVYLLEFKISMHPNLTDLSTAFISRSATVGEMI